MNTKHTPESVKDMPHVTVEQVIRFRDAALRIEQQRDELQAKLAIREHNARQEAVRYETKISELQAKYDELLKLNSELLQAAKDYCNATIGEPKVIIAASVDEIVDKVASTAKILIIGIAKAGEQS